MALVGRVGEKFFSEYLNLDACRYSPREDAVPTKQSKDRQFVLVPPAGPGRPFWSLSYRLTNPSKPWVNEPVTLTIDSTGAVAEMRGISDCLQNPQACDFSVDESTAVEAARRAAFDPGLTPWLVQFQWVSSIPVPRYAWVVTSNTHLEDDGCSGQFQAVTIDASTGEILDKSGFHLQCGFRLNTEGLPSEADSVQYDEPPVAVTTVKPFYTDHDRQVGLVGDVVVRVLVGKDGQVKSTRVVRGVTELTYLAVDAVRKWVFKPALSNHNPVAVWTEVSVHFPP